MDDTIQIMKRPFPRMRTAREAYQMIHKADPESRLSEQKIRSLAKAKVIPAITSGNRCLLNVDALFDYLANTIEQESDRDGYGQIRPVKERL